MVDRYMDKEGNVKDKLIELRFIDSFKFMASSLDSLMNNLVKGGRKLFGFDNYSELQYNLLTRKGIYPYEYMLSWGKFEESQLPPIEAFYSNSACLTSVKMITNTHRKFGKNSELEI